MNNLFIGLFLFIIGSVLFYFTLKSNIQFKRIRITHKQNNLLFIISLILIDGCLIFFSRFIAHLLDFGLSIFSLSIIGIIFIVLATIILSIAVQLLKTNIVYISSIINFLILTAIILSVLLIFVPIITVSGLIFS